jgi:hypothetical protein
MMSNCQVPVAARAAIARLRNLSSSLHDLKFYFKTTLDGSVRIPQN